MRYFAKPKQRTRYWPGAWYSHWPGGDASALAAEWCQLDRQQWPMPPRFSTRWAERRAIRWYRLMRDGRSDTFAPELWPFGRLGWEWKAWRGRRNARPLAELAAYGFALRWMAKAKAEGEGLSQAVSLAAQPNYLGDIAFVRSLVQNFIVLSICSRWSPSADADEAEEEFRLGRTFAGLEPGFTPVGSWNTRHGGLGAAIEAAFELDLAAFEAEAAEWSSDSFAYCITGAFCQVRDAASRFATNEYALKAIAGYTTAVLVGLHFEETFADILRELEAPG
jgi:hypothetical protein